MKIYILRHEDRTQDASFFSPLTEKGLINSNDLISKLDELNITKIYCSPYIRTMQTIYPFSNKNNIKLNLDYNLIEIQHESIIAPKTFGTELPLYIAKIFNYNPLYKSKIRPNKIKYPETGKDVSNRINKFLGTILDEHKNTNEIILLVTHQCVCQSILSLNKKINPTLYTNYNLGEISLVFENYDWNYKKIN